MTKHVVNDKLVDMNEAEQKAYDERTAENERLAVPRALEILRIRRNAKLQDCDWTDLPHSALTDEKKTEWQNYRTQLRNITDGITTVEQAENVTWPTEPGV